jgi:glycosyltransferase involved in cell wall biosynthesis
VLHVAQISFFIDRQRRAPEQLLLDWHSLPDVARAAAGAGMRVSVVQASRVEARFMRDGVDYHFISPGADGALLARSPCFVALMRELAPDVVHVHGLDFGREVSALRNAIPTTPILLQDHASQVPRIWRRRDFRRGARDADGIAFCARDQAVPFSRAGLFASETEIFEIPESTTTFTPGDRAAARAATGLTGDPAVLWVGHLNSNKDPLTVLDGIARATHALPGLSLWCCHATAPLLDRVQARVAEDARLTGRVRLLGHVTRDRVQELMRAADVFVLGSHREGSGYSVIEALATGLPAVVTDIPSFRALVGTGHDSAGVLWPCGDSAALASALAACASQRRDARERALIRFAAELSSDAVGRKLAAAYRKLVSRSGRDRVRQAVHGP